MDNFDKRIETKIDNIIEDIGDIKITLAKQHVTLDEHIRRTEILEEEMKPVKKHVYMVDGALKALGILGILAGILEAISIVIRN